MGHVRKGTALYQECGYSNKYNIFKCNPLTSPEYRGEVFKDAVPRVLDGQKVVLCVEEPTISGPKYWVIHLM